jgi:HK97 family phage major capsid protein
MAVADTQIRDRLKAVRDQLKDARTRRAEAQKEVDSAREAFGSAEPGEGQKITEMAEFTAAEDAVRTWGTIGDEIADLEQAEQGILHMLGGSTPNGNGNGTHPSIEMPRQGWDGHRLLRESAAFITAREGGVFNSTARFGTVVLGEIAAREEAVGFLQQRWGAALPGAPGGTDIGTPANVVQPDYRGIIPPRVRQLTLLDVVPTGTTDSNLINYVQVTGIPLGAVETAELAVKPQLGLTMVDATAPVRTIAGYVKAARQALDDVAGMATLINTLLPYEVRRRIEAQILAGDGTGQNLLGILNTAGIGAPAAVAGDNPADAILRALTTVILSDSDPNFVALNPLTWQELLLLRTAPGADEHTGSYLYGGPGLLASPTIWGMTITPSRIVPPTSALVGDAMGCTLLVREGVNVKTSDSDQDDFVRNRVTILAEARVAFPVWRPSAFAVATVS